MWNDASEIVIAGSGQVNVASVGTALPDTPTANLDPAFVGLGLISEDGAKLSVTPEIEEFKAWQSRHPVRRELVGQEITAAFELMQWNEETLVTSFGGGEITAVSGGYRYDFPDDSASLEEKAIVIDLVDGTSRHRLCFKRGTVDDGVETTFNRSTPAMLPVTFKIMAPEDGSKPGHFLSSSDAFAAGS